MDKQKGGIKVERGITMQTFITITNKTICDLIENAKWSIIYAAPGISTDVGDSIIEFTLKNGLEQAQVVIDPNPEVCRLGYGVINAIDKLCKNGIMVRKTSGLRIGVIIADNKAFVFSPTPLLLEAEPSEDEPNAIAVEVEQAEKLIKSICPFQLEVMSNNKYIKISLDEEHVRVPVPEIGKDEMTKKELDNAKENLEKAPPLQFDLERQVRVYHSFIQFVELKLIGCNIERCTISIPAKFINLIKNKEDKERLKTSYSLIGRNSKVTGKAIEDKVKELRKKYIRNIGPRFGNVILRQRKEEFEAEVKKLKEELNNFRNEAIKKLDNEFEKTKTRLVKALLPDVRKNPPDDLMGGIFGNKPSDDEIKRYIEHTLSLAMPKAEIFVGNMKLQCDYKDVTYEILNDKEFFDNLIKAFPYTDWPGMPYEEYNAAREAVAAKEFKNI